MHTQHGDSVAYSFSLCQIGCELPMCVWSVPRCECISCQSNTMGARRNPANIRVNSEHDWGDKQYKHSTFVIPLRDSTLPTERVSAWSKCLGPEGHQDCGSCPWIESRPRASRLRSKNACIHVAKRQYWHKRKCTQNPTRGVVRQGNDSQSPVMIALMNREKQVATPV